MMYGGEGGLTNNLLGGSKRVSTESLFPEIEELRTVDEATQMRGSRYAK